MSPSYERRCSCESKNTEPGARNIGEPMVMLRPFRPLRYNPAAVGDLSKVVAPPYDVISPSYRDKLYERSEHNVIRLILNRDADPYTAAATHLQDWRRQGILTRDAAPAFGYYVENFALADGSQHERAGLLATIRLEAFESGHIRPHEKTFARAKADRMRLIQACRTNLSAIFGMFPQPDDGLQPAREHAARHDADIDLRDDSGERHRVWFLTDPQVNGELARRFADAEVLIADGHHRYETALAYRDHLREQGLLDEEAPHNFILMYLCSMSDPGLVVLPTHRVLRELPLPATEVLRRVGEHFGLVACHRENLKQVLAGAPGAVGIMLAGSEKAWVATLEDHAAIEAYEQDVAPPARKLDVAILDRVLLRGLLELDPTAAGQAGRLFYTHDGAEAFDAVSQGAPAAFFLNAPKISDVMAISQAGATMPEKSTYFYPKLLSGLVFHPLDER